MAPRRRILIGGIVIAASLLVIVLVVRSLLAASPGARIGYAVLVAAFIVAGVLSVRYRSVERAIDAFFTGYLSVTLWALLTLIPVVFFGWISRLILERLPLIFQAIAFAAWGVTLGIALLSISTEARRRGLFERLSKVGAFTPWAYAFNVLWVAVMFFSSVTFLLAEQGLIAFSPGLRGPATAGRIADFYFWHFLEAMPVLKVNQTIRWTEPLGYDRTSVGLLLLLFKAVVIIPVIAAFLGYWKYRAQQAEKTGR